MADIGEYRYEVTDTAGKISEEITNINWNRIHRIKAYHKISNPHSIILGIILSMNSIRVLDQSLLVINNKLFHASTE